MSLSDDLESAFSNINIKIEPKVLKRCVELCTNYHIDAEEFMDQWLAYTASHLEGAPPTLDELSKLERREFQQGNQSVTHNSSKNATAMEVDIENIIEEDTINETPSFTTAQSDTIDNSQLHSTFYTQRTDARSIQCEFGPKTSFEGDLDEKITITVLNEDIINSKYMYEKLLLRQQSVNYITQDVVQDIVEHHNLELTKEKLKEYAGEMVICGRIYSDTPGKLNIQSVVLEGTLEMYRGQSLKLDLDKMDRLAIFNGQVVVMKGNNLKNRFVVKEIYSGAPLPLAESLTDCTKLQIVAASGPFTIGDNLMYEPLEDLLSYIVEFTPNVLILLGPFLDCTNTTLETLGECYDTFFETTINDIMKRVEKLGVQVVLIPSDRDIHNHPIFPSLPYRLQKTYKNLILAPNPCLLDFNGLLVGASTVDVLFHISKNEFFKDNTRRDGMDRMSRLAKHVLDQRNFYPLHPPDLDVRIDYQLLEKYGMFDKIPHVLILPSNLRHFVKKIDGCLVVNPERMTKGQVGGTFARIEVRPGPGVVSDRTTCQILRI